MRQLLSVLVLLFCSQSMKAADWKHFTLYTVEVLNCGMQLGDMGTSQRAFSLGAHEANPILVEPGTGGKPSWIKIGAYKTGICGIPFAIDWFVHKHMSERNADYTAFVIALGGLGSSSYAVGNNLGVIQAQKKINTALAARK